jgi:hypothetical protein
MQMLNLMKIRPARRAALAALKPFLIQPNIVAKAVLPTDWLHPHVLGFMSTAVTLIAEAANGPFRNHTLAAIQASVLATVTGEAAQLIGEEITHYSSTNDPEFAEGCQTAHHFIATLEYERRRHATDAAGIGLFTPEGAATETGDRQAGSEHYAGALPMNAQDLWRQHVLSYLTGQGKVVH